MDCNFIRYFKSIIISFLKLNLIIKINQTKTEITKISVGSEKLT